MTIPQAFPNLLHYGRFSFVLSLVLLSLSMLAGCGDSDEPISDGDLDLDPVEHESENPDGDLDADDASDRERPEAAWLKWEDDTYDQWTVRPFCQGGFIAFEETFEEEDFSAYEEWKLDYKVEGNPSGDTSGAAVPVIVSEEGRENHYLSGDSEDTQSGLPAARIYTSIPEDLRLMQLSYHFLTRLPGASGDNYLWLYGQSVPSDTPDPTGNWTPEIRLYHHAALPTGDEGSPQRIEALEQSGMQHRKRDGLDNGWHRVELYQSGESWRLDVDRVTLCEQDQCLFSDRIDSDHPLNYLFLGLAGHLDDIRIGKLCPMPDVGLACEDMYDCKVGEVCGRDNVCHETRAISCRADRQCEDPTKCIGEKSGGDLLGDGVCTLVCEKSADCLAGEVCMPTSATEGQCHALCNEEEGCPEGQICREILGVKGCVPEDCKTNGSWQVEPNGLLSCQCDDGFALNPYSNRCEDLGSCQTHSDCASNQSCGEGICYVNRDIACQTDDSCAEGLSCQGFILDDELASIGQCTAACAVDEECQPYERCLPVLVTPQQAAWSCLGRCDTDDDCDSSMSCVELESGNVCMTNTCQSNGEWSWSEGEQAISCTCTGEATADPFSGRCM